VIAQLCLAAYVRPDESVVHCTYLAGHPSERHSWFAVQAQDVVSVESHVDYTETAAQALVDAIAAGKLDPYIEAILAAGHYRKLALRGVRGFGQSHTFSLVREEPD
jgi:hypothetical protein